jgi:hypothetical protein
VARCVAAAEQAIDTGIELAHSRRRHADGPHTGTARRLSPPRVSRRPRDGGTSLRRAVRLRHRPTVDCRSRIGMSSPVRRQGVGARFGSMPIRTPTYISR